MDIPTKENAMIKGELVKVLKEAPLFGATKGRQGILLDAYWGNGEEHLEMQDARTGETFTSPACFWTEAETAECAACESCIARCACRNHRDREAIFPQAVAA